MLFVWEVMRAARRFRPDVVVSAHINLGPLTALVCAAVKARHVQNIYGRELWSGLSFLRRQACRRANAVLSDCENTLNRAIELNLVKAESHVVHDCVDLERFTPGVPDPAVLAHYGLARERGRFRILLLGRLNAAQRYKGTERAIHLLEGLPEDFEVVLAGSGDDITHVRAEAVRLGVGDRVLFPGSIAEAHLVDVYRSAGAFFLVSSVGHAQGEGLPLTPIEAMACGVPTMVGSDDGSREVIVSSGGITVAPSDLRAPRKYVLRLRAEPDFAAAEAVAARDRVAEEFDFPTFSERTLTAVTGG
jgi:phosphatidylinositol alpha-1,6-mannosyltransferase